MWETLLFAVSMSWGLTAAAARQSAMPLMQRMPSRLAHSCATLQVASLEQPLERSWRTRWWVLGWLEPHRLKNISYLVHAAYHECWHFVGDGVSGTSWNSFFASELILIRLAAFSCQVVKSKHCHDQVVDQLANTCLT